MSPPLEIIHIDDLLKARRRCTIAAFPSWLGGLPALALALLSLTEGTRSFAIHAAIAGAVIAGYVLMLEGRVLGAILQLGGIGALVVEFALSMRYLNNAIRASSLMPPPSMTKVWLFAGVVALFLMWGVFVTVRCRDIAARHPLGRSDLSRRVLFWRKAQALGLRRWTTVFLTGLQGVAVAAPALGISVVLYKRLETLYDYSTRTLVLGFLVYLTYMYLSGKWAQQLFFKARRLAALDASSLLEIDRRQPSLLLRSFKDDLTALTPQYELGRQYTAKVIDVTPEQLTLEETVSDVLSEFGPVIAIGTPGEHLPPVGAARQYLETQGWLDSVGHFMTRARWIAIVLGNTEGLSVEYARIKELGQLHKAIVILPPLGALDLEMRWKAFTSIALETTYEGLGHVLVATIPDGRRPVCIACKERDEQCYELAVRRALGILLQSAGGAHSAASANARESAEAIKSS